MLVHGLRADGGNYATEVFIPHAFTYLMMKLYAFDDRKADRRKDVGRHHAMDLYRIVAMMTEPEYQRTLELGRKQCLRILRVERGGKIAATEFETPTSLGMLRVREHRLYRDDLQIAEFISVLQGCSFDPRAIATERGLLMATLNRRGKTGDRYFDLVVRFPLRPIHWTRSWRERSRWSIRSWTVATLLRKKRITWRFLAT